MFLKWNLTAWSMVILAHSNQLFLKGHRLNLMLRSQMVTHHTTTKFEIEHNCSKMYSELQSNFIKQVSWKTKKQLSSRWDFL